MTPGIWPRPSVSRQYSVVSPTASTNSAASSSCTLWRGLRCRPPRGRGRLSGCGRGIRFCHARNSAIPRPCPPFPVVSSAYSNLDPVELYNLIDTVDDGSAETLTTTSNHPFYDVETGRFIPAREPCRPPLGEADRRLAAGGLRSTRNSSARRSLHQLQFGNPSNREFEEDHTEHLKTAGVWGYNI
jgi:hypothetical protein